MQVLQDEEHGFAALGQRGDVLRPGCVDAAVAQLVIQVAQAQLDEGAHVLGGIGRDKRGQLAKAIPRGVQQMADFQGIPVPKLLRAADEAAGLFRIGEFLNGAAVGGQIRWGHAAQDDHHVNVAGFGGFAPQVAALEADVDETIPKGGAQLLRQGGNIGVRMKHGIPFCRGRRAKTISCIFIIESGRIPVKQKDTRPESQVS